MADLQSNAPQGFQLPAPAQLTEQPNLGQGLANGLNQGVQNYATLTQAQVAQQQQQLAQQQLAFEQHKEQVGSALQLLATTGQQLQYLRPDSQKLAISNSLNALAKVAPEFGIQPHSPDQLPDESVDLIKSYAKLHEGYIKGDVSEPTFQTEGQRILGEMSMYERNMVKENANILGEPKFEPGQIDGQPVNFNPETGQSSSQATGQTVPGNFVPNTTIAREQNSRQMGAATASSPYIDKLKDYGTAIEALKRGDEIGDMTAIDAGAKFMGETPESMAKKAQGGMFGQRVKKDFATFIGIGAMTPDQRADFNTILNIHKAGLISALNAQIGMFPGAQGPNVKGMDPASGLAIGGVLPNGVKIKSFKLKTQ